MNANRPAVRTAPEDPPIVFESFVMDKRDAYTKYAYVKLGSWEDARDTVGEALLTLFRRLDVALASENFNAFAFKILKDAISDSLRKRRRRPATPAGLAFEIPVRPVFGLTHADPDQVTVRIEVHKAIGRLPARQRECVILHYLLGHPVGEVADLMGLKDSTVRSHLSSALTALGSALGDLSDLSDLEHATPTTTKGHTR